MKSPRCIVLSTALLLIFPAAVIRGGKAEQEPSGKASSQSPQELFRLLSHSVVIVESLDTEGAVVVQGSGVAVASDRVVTNSHVIKGAASVRVRQGDKTWPAVITHFDVDHDVCRLQVEGLGASAVSLRPSTTLGVGERVYSIGAPRGLELTLSEGIISGLRDFGTVRIIQTTTAISTGSSGGGLFDSQGRLIGITTFYVKEGQNLNFAVPVEWVVSLDKYPYQHEPREFLKKDTAEVDKLHERGLDAYLSGDYEQALQAANACIQLDPENVLCWIGLGGTYQELGQLELTLGAYKEVIRLLPESFSWWFHIAEVYLELKRYKKAAMAYQESIRLYPSSETDPNVEDLTSMILNPLSGCWRGLADAYLGLSRYEESVEAFREAIRLDANDPLAWEGLGRAYYGLQEFDKAITAYQGAIRLSPQYGTAWYNLGLAYASQGKRTRVMQIYEKLKSVDQDMADEYFRDVVLP
jgi:tetratricopeptide (TPR) repeat protein